MKKVIRRHESTGSMFRDPLIKVTFWISRKKVEFEKSRIYRSLTDQRGDVPGWVLVVLMTTGLVTAIWTIAAPRLTAILKNSLDAMNGIR
jgi:hypothetical protein